MCPVWGSCTCLLQKPRPRQAATATLCQTSSRCKFCMRPCAIMPTTLCPPPTHQSHGQSATCALHWTLDLYHTVLLLSALHGRKTHSGANCTAPAITNTCCKCCSTNKKLTKAAKSSARQASKPTHKTLLSKWSKAPSLQIPKSHPAALPSK